MSATLKPPGHYDQLSAGAITPLKLLPQVTCPHCWEYFSPVEVLWISEHVDMLGDALLGPERQQRFLPSRYTLQGDAIDAKGMTCRNLACPRCHLPLPRGLLEMEPLFISIIGAVASGKSYFLAAMTWLLRQVLPLHFKLAFTEADPESNRALNASEEALFLNPNDSEVVPLPSIIRKTQQLGGDLYDTVAYGQRTVTYPRPFLFTIQPQEGHIGGDAARLSRMLCLYDNAGEHFEPGQDTASSPVTRHLAQSRAILFLFDPTQNQRFRAVCRAGDSQGAAQRGRLLSRQETILNEAAARIRRLMGLSQGAKYERPLIIVVTKRDEWAGPLGLEEDGDPWRTQGNMTGVDVEKVEQASARLREILLKYCPEVVSAAESFAKDITYIAVSCVGSAVELDTNSGLPGIRPRNIRPYWVTIPLLYSISRVFPALVPRLIRRAKQR